MPAGGGGGALMRPGAFSVLRVGAGAVSRRVLCVWLAFALAAALVVSGPSRHAEAQTTPQTLVSNIQQTGSGTGNSTHDHAQEFTTGDNALGYTVTSADIFFTEIADGQIWSKSTVTIRSDSSGSPGTVLATLTDPSKTTATSHESLTFTAPGQGVDLDPNTKYWLVLDYTAQASGNNRISNVPGDGEDGGAASGWSIRNQGHFRTWNSNGGWTSFESSRRIAIKGFPIVPSPPPTIPPLPRANLDGSFPVPADWPLIPSDTEIEPGDTFRLLFVTLSKRDATSTDIADYNTHVQNAAARDQAQAAIKQFAAGFRVVGCTTAVTARANTDSEASDLDAPIYWLNGVKAADDYADFYDGNWDNQVEASIREETGAQPSSAPDVFTGCGDNGTSGSMPLGTSGTVGTGSPIAQASPLEENFGPPTIERPLYAMSPVFKVEEVIDPNERFDLSVLDDNSPAGFLFRVCPEGRTCDPDAPDGDTNWVPTLNPIVTLQEGGDPVSYQYKFHWPGDPPVSGTLVCDNGTCWLVDDLRVTFDVDAFSDYRNSYRHDRDRLNCLDSRNTGGGGHGADTWGAYVRHQANRDRIAAGDTSKLPTNELWLHGTADGSNVGTYPERTAGAKVVSDMWGGCAPYPNSYSTVDHDVWKTVTVAAGHDPDAFSHDFVMYHEINWGHLDRMGGLVRRQDPNVKVHIVDDDEWEQNIEVASFDGTTTGEWILLERQGLQKALPEAIAKETTYQFKARLVTNRDDGTRTPQRYQLGPQKDWISIWADEPHRTLADHPPYGIRIGWGYGIPLDAEVIVNIRAEARASKGPLVIRQSAPSLRFTTDYDLPERLGADPSDSVTTIGTDASRSSNRYWFENYEHATCVDCNLMSRVTPVVNITGNSAGVEGDSVFFKLTADPSGAEVPVDVKVAADGDYGVVTGYRTVTIPAGGTLTLFLPTENDDNDELDGSATLTILAGDGYSVGAVSTMTSYIQDDDDYSESPLVRYAALIERIKTDMGSPNYRNEAYDLKRVLKTLGVPEYADSPGSEVSVGEATNRRTRPSDNPHWEGIAEALRYKIAHDAWAALNPPTPDPDQVITITGGSGITEGGAASFTITADPAPASPITVNVGVSQTGDWGATGAATVSVSGATTTYTITTTDDKIDEVHGSVTATVQAGNGYTVGAPASATVAVSDDDDYSEAPLVKYAALVERIKTDLLSPNYSNEAYDLSRVLKTLGLWAYADSPGPAVSVGEATNRRTKPADNPHWEGIAEAIQYKLDYDAWATVNPPPPDPDPVITITAGTAITEGATASFTISADPVPASPVTVNVGVSQSGDFGATGAATVSVSGATTAYTIDTADDQVDEPDGSVTATVQSGTGYTVGTASTATVAVADDDYPTAPLVVAEDPLVKYATLVQSFYDRITANAQHGDGASGGWNKRFLKAMGHAEYVNYPQAAATVQDARDRWQSGANTSWDGTVEAIEYKLAYDAGTVNPPPTPDPEITISGGAGITEGGTATFTISANPAPASPITVNVGVTQSGSWGASGAATVTVSGATATYTIATSDDNTDEPDGSVTATVQSGSGYTIGTASSATVAVADDDAPPPATPEITISGGSAITEGGTATFTISASPAPASPITVNVGVTQSGAFGAAGAATVSVSGATTTYTITTSDDQVDEPDGTVTATVQAGSGYTVGTASSATVAVTDDDDAPAPTALPTISIEDSSTSERSWALRFWVALSEASDEDITVRWQTLASNDPDRRARGGQDYWEMSGQILIRAGETRGSASVWLEQDTHDEPDELFTVYIHSPVGATIDRGEATMTILDDD